MFRIYRLFSPSDIKILYYHNYKYRNRCLNFGQTLELVGPFLFDCGLKKVQKKLVFLSIPATSLLFIATLIAPLITTLLTGIRRDTTCL